MISIISPAYNVNKYLDDFFTSLLELEAASFELIFIDDRGSEDVEPFYEKYKNLMNIKLVTNTRNLGLGFSRNEGLKVISEKTTHVFYLDSDDVINDSTFIEDIEPNAITTFNYVKFSKVYRKEINANKSFGGNLFRNTIWGIAIPVSIAKENRFETRNYEDLLVNRRILNKKDVRIFNSNKAAIGYRIRKSSISSSTPTPEKYRDFLYGMNHLIAEGHNTYRFNIQEIYQYYWMWRKHLKKEIKISDLPKTKLIYKIMFCVSGSLIRFLRLESIVYGRPKKNSFE